MHTNIFQTPATVILIPRPREKDPRVRTDARRPLGFFAALRMTEGGAGSFFRVPACSFVVNPVFFFFPWA